MNNHIHGLFFYCLEDGIKKDEMGYYRLWHCGICGNPVKKIYLPKFNEKEFK